jgi:hypothetical protein
MNPTLQQTVGGIDAATDLIGGGQAAGGYEEAAYQYHRPVTMTTGDEQMASHTAYSPHQALPIKSYINYWQSTKLRPALRHDTDAMLSNNLPTLFPA